MAVPPTGMSLGSVCRRNWAMAAPSEVSGKPRGSPAKATAPKRAPLSSRTMRATSALARAMREGATSRAYMLLEKSRITTTSRLVAGTSFWPRLYWGRARATKARATASTSSTPLTVRRVEASKVVSAATRSGTPKRATARRSPSPPSSSSSATSSADSEPNNQ